MSIENSEVRVFSDLPFSLSPNLDKDPEVRGGLDIQDEFDIHVVDLDLKGRVRFIEIQPDLDSGRSLVFPAGLALPLRTDLYLESLTQSGLQLIGFLLIYGNQIFKGVPNFDDTEIVQNEAARLNFWYFIDPATGNECKLLFPREAVKDISYLITV